MNENWRIEMPPQIPVTPKLIYQSKSFIGIAITFVGIVLPPLSQQSWISPDIAKLLADIGGVCQNGGPVLTAIGVIDRKDTFFRPGEMQKAAQQAAANLTIVEAAETIQQGLKVATAPAAEKPGLAVDLLWDIQRRLTNQDAALAEIKAASTAQQFPPLVDYPDRTDLPRDPRQMAQVEAPPVPLESVFSYAQQVIQGQEPDVTTANGEGVLENY